MKKLKKLLVIVATISCMLLALALTTMAADLYTTEGVGPDTGPANENSFLKPVITTDDVQVRIGGNGNSARLNATINGIDFVTNERPVNNTVNTIYADGFEIDVFVRGNKIDGVLGVWDLNCYNDCPSHDGCKPTRANSCDCGCECSYFCNHLHEDVTCAETGGLCDAYEFCDDKDCEEKPRDGIDCRKDPRYDNWKCAWECTCACDCEFEAQSCDCDKCPVCDGCTEGDNCCCDSADCCEPCYCSTTNVHVCTHWLCDSCRGYFHQHDSAHPEDCVELGTNENKNYNFFCADINCGMRHPDSGWNYGDEDRPSCYAAAGCTTDDCPDDECSEEDPPLDNGEGDE